METKKAKIQKSELTEKCDKKISEIIIEYRYGIGVKKDVFFAAKLAKQQRRFDNSLKITKRSHKQRSQPYHNTRRYPMDPTTEHDTKTENSLGHAETSKEVSLEIKLFKNKIEKEKQYLAAGNLYETYCDNGLMTPDKADELIEYAILYDLDDLATCLGEMFEDGVMITKSLQKAYKLYVHAYKLGHSRAADNLGFLYWRGIGVEKNYRKAVYYFEKAYFRGYTDVVGNLEDMLSDKEVYHNPILKERIESILTKKSFH